VTCIRLGAVNSVWYIYVPCATQAVVIARCGPETVFKEKHGAWDPITLCRFQRRLQHMYHGHWALGNPMPESTLSFIQELRIWLRGPPGCELLSCQCHPCPECIAVKRKENPENSALVDCCYNVQQRIVKLSY
jgi:hypothetical protein